MTSQRHRILREGATVGLIGATVVIAWFAVIDAVQGHFLATPLLLGTMLSTVLAHQQRLSQFTILFGYTLLHFLAFLGIGIGLARVVNVAERAPATLLGALVVFACMEVAWFGMTLILEQGFGSLIWWQVLVANLLSVSSMAFYLWRRHPALARRVNEATRLPAM